MNNTFLSVFICLYFCLTNFVKTENNEIKWFLYKENLYYIDVNKNVNSYQAQQFCLDNDMVYIMDTSEKHLFNDILYNDKHETNPFLWILDENYLFHTPNKELPNECYAMNGKNIRPENCSFPKGVICKTKITGANIQFKNGTYSSVDIDGANQFCDPRTDKYDNEIEYCLIDFMKLLL